MSSEDLTPIDVAKGLATVFALIIVAGAAVGVSLAWLSGGSVLS